MWDQWLRLPLGVRLAIIVLALISIVALIAVIDRHAALLVLGGFTVIGLLLAAFFALQKWQASRAGQRFAEGLSYANVSSPRAVSDPAHRARLTELRSVFEHGLSAFNDAGKDLYSLPWYLVCGEPGSGKTETIRHSNVGFPPGLQDEMQGVGGTINMHWWFTNHAILLDTAGKMLFHETQPGTTSEWQEFLNLLKSHRPRCPINGLLLVIPADSLLKDTPEEIQRKAGRIVHQLDQIQKVLDVRFPVFVLITKCDLVYGFREFFANVREAEQQQQMMGWSNPEPLDVPFRPELVTTHIDEVASRLRRRCMALLRDPVPAGGNGRLDEVDAFYEFPQNITAISPRLKQYLEIIFVSGEWTQRPLFLRGIYFTSALIEGNALDVELAKALGIPVDHLTDLKSWDRERSFFLRDLFIDKIFRERGLVTNASNAQAIVRTRRIVSGGIAFAGVAALLLVSWFGARALKQSVLTEADFWQTAARGWSHGRWHPIIEPTADSASWRFAGKDSLQVGRQSLTLIEFHDQLQRIAAQDVFVPWIFRPMAQLVAGTNHLRREAQRAVFDGSVTGPLVDSTRRMLLDNSQAWDDLNAERMAFLLKVEGDVAFKKSATIQQPLPKIESDYFFHVTLQPWLEMQRVPRELVRVFDATFPSVDEGSWPEAWISGGQSLADNVALAQGWITFSSSIRTVRANQQLGVDQIRDTRVAIEHHLTIEKRFLRAISEASGEQDEADFETAFASLTASRSTVDEMLNRTAALEGMPASLFTLQTAYHSLFEQARQKSRAAAKSIANAIGVFDLPPSSPGRSRSDELPLFRDVRAQLVEIDRAIDEAYRQSLTPDELNRIPKLDMEATVPSTGTADRVYAYRYNVYRDLLDALNGNPDKHPSLLSHLGEAFSQQKVGLSEVNARIAKYEGELRPDFLRATRSLLERAGIEGPIAIAERHNREFENLVAREAGFPVLRGAGAMNESQMREFYAQVQAALADTKLDVVPTPVKALYAHTSERITRVMDFLSTVAKPSGQAQMVHVRIASLTDQRRVLQRIAPTQPFARIFAGNRFRSLRVGDKALRTQNGAPAELIWSTLNAPLPDLEFFIGADPKARSDARFNFITSWPALRLVLDKSSLSEDGGKTWLCPLSLPTSDGPSYFVLSLEFDVPVLSPDRWPDSR